MVVAPVFPLPNVVLFPRTVIPLHIFEERYRVMTREALEGDRKIVIALLREGWESDYEESPPVYDVACLGRIGQCEELEDGKYNVVLEGLQRVRLLREVQQKPYRRAEIEFLHESELQHDDDEVVRRRNRLGGLFSRYTELSTNGRYRAVELVPQFDFEVLVNTVATILNVAPEAKQTLLELDDLTARCDALIPVLQKHLEALVLIRGFEHLRPKDPSLN
jgi:uncharacterized protein